MCITEAFREPLKPFRAWAGCGSDLQMGLPLSERDVAEAAGDVAGLD